MNTKKIIIIIIIFDIICPPGSMDENGLLAEIKDMLLFCI
jgi:hypothetical protein